MNFTLKIDLGNDAMRTRGDVVNALKNAVAVGDAHLTIGDGGIVRDSNGNTVGRWDVSDDAKTDPFGYKAVADRFGYGKD